jgi:protein O-mannosyl-transferase
VARKAGTRAGTRAAKSSGAPGAREVRYALPVLAPMERPQAFRLALAAAAALALVLHLGALRSGFVGDDHYLVERNPLLRADGAFGRALRPGAWGEAADPWDRDVNARFFRPVTSAWFVVDAHLFGASARGFHAVSLAIHAAATVLVGLLLAALTRSRRSGALGALLFAVHPVHVEPVSMITYRTTLAEGLFFLAALVLEIAARDTAAPRRRLALRLGALVAFVLALGSKETAVTLPAVIFLACLLTGEDHASLPGAAGPRPRSPATRLRAASAAAAPYAVLAAAALVVRAAVTAPPGWTFFAGADRPTVVCSMLGVLTLDLRLLLAPLRFTPFYDWSLVLRTSPWSPDVLTGALIALALVGLPILAARRAPRAALLSGALAVLLLPLMNFVPFTVAAGERLLYLPSVMWVGLCALGAEWLLSRGHARVAVVLVALVLPLYGLQSVRRTSDWRSDETLLRATVRDYPESVAGQVHLARHLAALAPARSGAREEACAGYRVALRLEPALGKLRAEADALGCAAVP